MATVHLPADLQPLAGGATQLTIPAARIRDLLAELYARHPALREPVSTRMAVVIDGTIVNQPLLETLAPDSEVHLVQRIAGG